MSKAYPVTGIRLGVATAGVKSGRRNDLVVVEIAGGSSCAAVFTQNRFCAAPVVVARQHLQQHIPHFILINSGNANAGMGDKGINDARQCCNALAKIVNHSVASVVPLSTGVIGEPLPVDRIIAALPHAVANLDADAWTDAAQAVMTTDTVAKTAALKFGCDGTEVTVTGFAKGSGMIRPDMATMLAFMATDAPVAAGLLQRCLNEVVALSFNAITVDGDTSTNDACLLVATGRKKMPVMDSADSRCYQALRNAIMDIAVSLAQAIVRDGEGATRFITIEVMDGRTVKECRQVADAIAHSPLVKTAFFAGDPNWGRILAAIGRVELPEFDIRKLAIFLGDVCVARDGGRAPDYSESQAAEVMKHHDIRLQVKLGRGVESVRVWTCDLSYDYVRINAEYRT